MNSIIFQSSSDQETKNIGAHIAELLHPGDIVCLQGDLGAGKTTLVKGIAHTLGVREEITSPTFTIMQIHTILPKKTSPDNLHTVVHMDTYRLQNADELVEIGVTDYLGEKNTICLIEWPEKIADLLENKKTILVQLTHEKNGRKIEVVYLAK